MRGKRARQLRRAAQMVAYQMGLSWKVYLTYIPGRTHRLADCGYLLYKMMKKNYTRFKHPLGEHK